MAEFPVIPIGIWLSISSVVYTLLWAGSISRFGLRGIAFCNLGLSVIMSPGFFAGGHGGFPFPGGAVVLLGGTGNASRLFHFNLAMWILTFLIFSIYSWYLKKSDSTG